MEMSSAKTAYCLALAAALGLASPGSYAVPDEIQVYTEEMDDPGEFGLELHVNYVPRGEKTAPYDGAMPSYHMLQLTPEFSYGITKTLEAGLYLPVAFSGDGTAYGNGARLRLKYIAPRDEADAFFWGINTEVGYFSHRVSESNWGIELRPIIGYRGKDWLVAFNPILDADLSSNVSRKPNFEPALKLTRTVREGVRAGLEYYGAFGPLFDPASASERSHFLYAVVDVDLHGFDFNLGVGRGYGAEADTRVVKAIISLPFK
jgi:hypothetical protein